MLINGKDLKLISDNFLPYLKELNEFIDSGKISSFDKILEIEKKNFNTDSKMYVIKKIDLEELTSPALHFASRISPVDILLGFEKGICRFVPANFLCIGIPFRIIEKILNKDLSLEDDNFWMSIVRGASEKRIEKVSRMIRRVAYEKFSDWISYCQRIEYINMRNEDEQKK